MKIECGRESRVLRHYSFPTYLLILAATRGLFACRYTVQYPLFYYLIIRKSNHFASRLPSPHSRGENGAWSKSKSSGRRSSPHVERNGNGNGALRDVCMGCWPAHIQRKEKFSRSSPIDLRSTYSTTVLRPSRVNLRTRCHPLASFPYLQYLRK